MEASGEAPGSTRVVRVEAIRPEELPPLIPVTLALRYVAQELSCSVRMLYYNGVAERVPKCYTGWRRMRGGGLKLTTRRVRKEELLALVAELTAPHRAP